MANTKPVGVAFSDPELTSGTTITGAAITDSTISGATISGSTSTTTTVSGTFTGPIRLPVAAVAATGTNQATASALAEGINVV